MIEDGKKGRYNEDDAMREKGEAQGSSLSGPSNEAKQTGLNFNQA